MSQRNPRNSITLPKRSRLAVYESARIRHDQAVAHYKAHPSLYARKEPPKLTVEPPSADDVLEDLRDHLQVAIMVELSTIPTYLYGMYSVKNNNDPAVKTIRQVVTEEMLHLVLAGNTLLATNGRPRTYPTPDEMKDPNNPFNFPLYPMVMSDRYPYVLLTLRKLDEKQRLLFIDIEQRDDTPDTPPLEPADAVLGLQPAAESKESEEYESLGDFYRHVQQLVNEVGAPAFAQPGAENQISKDDGIYWDKGLIVVQSPEDADAAMQTIIDQGEGATEASTDNHLYKFQNMTVPPFEGIYDAKTNPHTGEYTDAGTKAVSEFFDASYGFLLLSIEYLWQTSNRDHRTALSNNIFRIMIDILRPVAQWLFKQSYNGTDLTAGPTFEYYPFNTPYEENALKDLKAAAEKATSSTIDLDVRDAAAVVDKLTALVQAYA